MNLAWIAAVLSPGDVAPHPNFRDAGYDSQAPARLAAIVIGDPWRLHRGSEVLEGSAATGGVSESDEGVVNVEKSLDSATIREGTAGLTREILTEPSSDPARSCALALLACNQRPRWTTMKPATRYSGRYSPGRPLLHPPTSL